MKWGTLEGIMPENEDIRGNKTTGIETKACLYVTFAAMH